MDSFDETLNAQGVATYICRASQWTACYVESKDTEITKKWGDKRPKSEEGISDN